jgi:hypothetical protein
VPGLRRLEAVPTENLRVVEQHMGVAVIGEAPALAFRERVRIPENGQEPAPVDLLGDTIRDVDDHAVMRKRAEEAVPIVDDVKDVGAGLHVERDLLEDLVVRHRDDIHLGPGRFLEGFPNHKPADHMRLNHHEVESHARKIGRCARRPGT